MCMRTWDGEYSVPLIMRCFNFLVTVEELKHTCTLSFHIASCCLIWSWSNFAVSQTEREREACCHDNMTRKQRRSDEMRLINSDPNNWIVEYFTVYVRSDEGACHVFGWFISTWRRSSHFLSPFLGGYRFSGTLVTLVIALIAPDVDRFILWEWECDVLKWLYPAEGMSGHLNVILAQGGKIAMFYMHNCI